MSTFFKLAVFILHLLPSAPYVALDGVWRLPVPSQWIATRSDGVSFSLSRDGTGIQSIRGGCRSQDAPFDALAESLHPNGQYLDLTQKVSAGLLRAYSAYSPELISVGPWDRVGGVRVALEFRNDRGVRQRLISASFLRDGRYCRIDLLTPTVHYLERDMLAFDDLLASMRHR